MQTKAVTPEAIYFEPNSPFWSDDAKKQRWIIVPAGKKVVYGDSTDVYDYPEGTYFVKNFSQEVVPGDSTTRILWETRILANKKKVDGTEEWHAFSYKWRKDQSDADLVSLENGMNDTLRIYPKGRGQPGVLRKWRFPSQSDCHSCHNSFDGGGGKKTRTLLGFFSAQLNKPAPKQLAINQLVYLFNQGIFDRQPDPAKAPRWHAIDDESAPLDNRARAYIAANCSGCHGTRGIEFGVAMEREVNYDFHRGVPEMELRTYELTWGFGIDSSALVAPGRPDKSIILYRQKARRPSVNISNPVAFDSSFYPDTDQMPPLATYLEDTVATKVLARWIAQMEPLSIGSRGAPLVFRKPLFKNRHLYLTPDLAARPGVKVQAFNAAGLEVPIHKVGQGVYQVGESLPRGVYHFKVGNQSFTHCLL